jgi:type II secretory pathway pseudopilin PulG
MINNKGQSLIEFIVAVGILIIISATGAIAVLGSLSATRLAKEQVQASGYAQEGIEASKSIRNQDWDFLINGSYGIDDSQGFWEFTETPNTLEDKFTRTIIIEDAEINGEVYPDTKKISSTASWNYSPTRPKQIEYITYLTKWQTTRAVLPGGAAYGTCNDYCVSIGYSLGICAENPNKCVNYVPFGDQYCMGGPSEDTCCCQE